MSRYLVLVLLSAGMAFAVSDDGAELPGQQAALPGDVTDDIVVTIVNTWSATYASQILDVEYRASDDAVLSSAAPTTRSSSQTPTTAPSSAP